MSRYLNNSLQSLAAYVPGEQPRDMAYIKLNTNESPFPPAPKVMEAVTKEQVELLRLYSDPECKGLKEKLAKLYGVEPKNIFVGNGSDEVLNFLFLGFAQDGVVFPDITYGFYKVFSQLYGLDYTQIPLKEDFSVDPSDYFGSSRMTVIANPNAPTGMNLSLDQIEAIVKANQDHVVVIDEAYVDFGGETAYPLTEKYDNLIVVRTFSKSRSLAGARLGYAIGPEGLIADLEKIRYSTNPYNIDRLALLIGEAAVESEDYYQEKCAEIIRVREMTRGTLEKMGFEVLPSKTNFLFAQKSGISGAELYAGLRRRGILVRHFTQPRIENYVRITVGTQEQMEKACAALFDILQEAGV